MIEDINDAVGNLNATLICGASFRIVEISYKEYCILHFYGVAYNGAMQIISMSALIATVFTWFMISYTTINT